MEVTKVELKLILMHFGKASIQLLEKISLGHNYVYNHNYLTYCIFSLFLLNI